MSKIEDRLVRQLSAKGVKNAKGLAHAELLKHGSITPNGTLTAKGKERQAMGNDGRAKDREARDSGGKHKPSDYTYDAKTNRATLRKP